MEITHMGKVVGKIVDGVYEIVRYPRHFMGIFQGFGISERVIKKIRRYCNKIRITYYGVKGDEVYEISVDDYVKKSKIYDHDDDRQLMVAAKDMIRVA